MANIPGFRAILKSGQTVEGHLLEADPHPQYLTSEEGDAAYDALGAAATVQGNLDSHTGDTTNPHSVTAAQVGADPIGTAAAAISSHIGDADPHTQYILDTDIGVTVAPALGADDNYVTDAEKVVIGNTSGINTGDETAAGILAKLITVDGTGSGLDADTVDGLHASDFAIASHLHTGVYEPADATILKEADIGVTVQAYDADLTTWAGITPAAGIGTFLATPSSANLLAAVTDETGTGALVFGTAPTISELNVTANSSNAALTVTQTGSGNALVVNDVSGDTTPFVIDAAGRIINGHTVATDMSIGGMNVAFQKHSIGSFYAANSIGIANWGSNAVGMGLATFKSRGAGTIGAHGAVVSGDSIGEWRMFGSDGTAFVESARIQGAADGTISTGVVPGKITIKTANSAGTSKEALKVDSAQSVLAQSPTGGIGYGTGAGGTVTQATDKSTGVTLNKVTGDITMNAASLAADTTVSFTLTNSALASTDQLVITHNSGGTGGAYNIAAFVSAGSAVIYVRNVTAGALAEAIVLRYKIIKGATA